MQRLANKQFEIFCGTGGVGKTTLATARAIFLAQSGARVLLITIDPSKRLKDLLNLKESRAGEIENIPISSLMDDKNNLSFDAILMSPEVTLKRFLSLDDKSTFGTRKSAMNGVHPPTCDLIAKTAVAVKKECENREALTSLDENKIVKMLTGPYGGMTEILAPMELCYFYNQNNYQTIILDTPPGKHFLDFLESCQKLRVFFDQKFINSFADFKKYLSMNDKKYFNNITPKKFISKIFDNGMKKIFSYIEKMTSGNFLQQFVEVLELVYDLRSPFLQSLKLQELLLERAKSNWFLVTAVEQGKVVDALSLYSKAEKFIHSDFYILLNKCMGPIIHNWETSVDPSLKELIAKISNNMLERERQLKQQISKCFSEQNCFEFSEVLETSKDKQLIEIVKMWDGNL